MMVIGGTAFVKTTSEETERVLADSEEMFRTPFSFGVAAGHARLLGEGSRSYGAPPPTLASVVEREIGEGRAFLMLAGCQQAEGRYLARPPIGGTGSEAGKGEVVLTSEGRELLIAGISMRDTAANREDASKLAVLKSVFGVRQEADEASGRLLIHASALRLRSPSGEWLSDRLIERLVHRRGFDAIFRLAPESTLTRASWRSYYSGHINAPPGRRVIPEEVKASIEQGNTPYVPLPARD
jgi:hypothetical protein